jgi:TetR/AcrR family transcriptional regulator, copper-responsive repressor
MGRPKKFTRDEVLKSAIPVFWDRGYADTGLHDLEQATGVNKSGLYAEFKSKEELFLASLRYYVEHIGAQAILSAEPLGWGNIERLAKMTMECRGGRKGCFGINSMRETAILPAEAHKILSESKARLKGLLEKNIRAEKTKLDAGVIAGIVATFFSGLCVEQNLKTERASPEQKIEDLMTMLRSL